jgi:hypothetical protein
MSKSDDLETLSNRALKAILAWMNTQGRVQSDKWTGWIKDECVESRATAGELA